MNDLFAKSAGGVLSYFGGFAFGSLKQMLWWLGSLILGQIGWPGVIAIAAGLVLLLSLSARAVKCLTSPRGMAITAAVLLIGLAVAWFYWPKREAAAAMASVARQPRPVAAVIPPPAEPVPPEPEIDLAMEEPEPEPEPVAKKKKLLSALPLMPIPVPADDGLILLTPQPPHVVATMRPPIIVGHPAVSRPVLSHHAAAAAPQPAAHAAPAPVAIHQQTVQPSPLMPTPYGQHPGTSLPATAAPHVNAAAAQRAMAAGQTEMILRQAAGVVHQLNEGTFPLAGSHPQEGMHPLGGMHQPPPHGGMGHPLGGMGHLGGHQ